MITYKVVIKDELVAEVVRSPVTCKIKVIHNMIAGIKDKRRSESKFERDGRRRKTIITPTTKAPPKRENSSIAGSKNCKTQMVATKPKPQRIPAKVSSATAVDLVESFSKDIGFIKTFRFESGFDVFDHAAISAKIKCGGNFEIIKIFHEMLNVTFFAFPVFRRAAEDKFIIKIRKLFFELFQLRLIIHILLGPHTKQHAITKMWKLFFLRHQIAIVL